MTRVETPNEFVKYCTLKQMIDKLPSISLMNSIAKALRMISTTSSVQKRRKMLSVYKTQ